ncbi:MAG: band 7 protein, partial [Thiothrix litoralis]
MISSFYYEFLLLGLVSTLLLLLYVLYVRVPVDAAYLRTGLGKPKVLLGRGGFVLPFLHTLTPVN